MKPPDAKDYDAQCLFHKPGKNDDEAREFYQALGKQSTVEVDEEGNEKLVFKTTLSWGGYVFPQSRSFFCEAIFEGDADFSNATFEGDADFSNATFEGRTDFGGATFKGGGDFSDATFKGEAQFVSATFEGYAGFSDATFKGEAQFVSATFDGGTSFFFATFEGAARFDHATFRGISVFFLETMFEGDAGFTHVTFNTRATYRRATFQSRAYFSRALFEGIADFSNALFEGIADFSRATFRGDADFGLAGFSNDASFQGVLFERLAYFAHRRFGGTLSFANAEFRQGVEMEKDWRNPETGKYQLPEAEREGCRVQRISYEKEGRKDAADSTFVREMRAARRARTHGRPFLSVLSQHISNWFELVFVDLSCEYGTNWQRLIVMSFMVVLAFAGAYCFLPAIAPAVGGIYSASKDTDIGLEGIVSGEQGTNNASAKKRVIGKYSTNGARVGSFGKLLYFSATTSTISRSVGMYPRGPMRFLVLLQSLLGAFFVALFVVVFARQWMR